MNEALDQLTFVAEHRPDDDSVHAQLAAVYRALGNTEKAVAEMKLQRELLHKRSEAARMKEASFHLTLLAKNRQGFQNLIKLASAAFLEGFPTVTRDQVVAFLEQAKSRMISEVV